MLNSLIIAGNDLPKIWKETVKNITIKGLIALNQDPLIYQARRLIDNGDIEVLAYFGV